MRYIIYTKGKTVKFVGFTDEKKTLRKFLEERPDMYDYEKVDNDDVILQMGRNIKDFYLLELNTYPEYNNRLLFGYEANKLHDLFSQRFTEINRIYLNVNRAMIHIRMEDDEYATVRKFMEILEMMSDDLMGHDVYAPFNEYFDIDGAIDMLIRNS